MNRLLSTAICINCGANDNETDARFCQTCGMKLGAALSLIPVPPVAQSEGTAVAGSYVLQGLLWTAPHYNAYAATSKSGGSAVFTIIEQATNELGPEGENASAGSNSSSRMLSGNLEVADSTLEQFGLIKPVE